MRGQGGDRSARNKTNDKRRRLLWGFLFPVLIGGSMIASIGVADVILSYQAGVAVGANVNTDFYYQDGSNYAVASADGFVTIACSGAAPATPTTCGGVIPAGQSTETITIHGIDSAAVYDVQLTEFAVSAGFPAGVQTFNLAQVLASSTVTGPTCVYAFVTTQAPTSPASPSPTQPSGQPVGCGVFEPTVAGGSEEDLDVMGAAIDNPTGCIGQAGVTYVGGACGGAFYTGQASFGTATVLLYISMVIVSSGTAPTGTASFFINPVVV